MAPTTEIQSAPENTPQSSQTTESATLTACTLDCPDSCSLSVSVDTDGSPIIEAGRNDPLTDGFICSKVKRFSRHLDGEHRLHTPLLRRGVKGAVGAKGASTFHETTWDEALDQIAARMRQVKSEHGGEAILPLSYGGSNGLLSQDTTDALLFARLGASRLDRTVCAAPSSAAAAGLYGKMAGVALEDYPHSRLIIIWGANPSATGIHVVPKIREAQKNGARLVVIDPRRTPLSKQADLALQPMPGTDLALALCLIRELFERGLADEEFLAAHCDQVDELRERAAPWTVEEAARVCDLRAQDIESLLALYSATSPAVIRCGWGVERNRNGGSAISAILALPAVAGKFGVRGGGYTMSNSGAWSGAGLGAGHSEAWTTRRINQNLVGQTLIDADPPVKLLFVYNHNPLMTLPNQEAVRRGLERDDLFTVVFDQVMTDTAHYADVVLPATTFLEHEDLAKGYGQLSIQRTRPAIEPRGQARSNVEVFADLLRRCELDQPGDALDDAALRARILQGQESQLEHNGRLEPPCGSRPIQFVDCFPNTPEHKVQLVPPILDESHPLGLYRFRPNDHHNEQYPLHLISPASRHRISSTFGQLDDSLVRLAMHPEDAEGRNLTGDADERVEVKNRFGRVQCGVRIDESMRRGVVELPKGLWAHNTHNGSTANALAPDSLTDIAGGACFNDACVEVVRL